MKRLAIRIEMLDNKDVMKTFSRNKSINMKERMSMKKLLTGLTTAALALSSVLSAGLGFSQVAHAEEETLIVSAAGVYDYVIENIEEFEKENNVKVEVWDKDMFEVLEGITLDGPAGTGADVMIAPYDRIGGLGITGQIKPVQLLEDANYDETDIQQVTAQDQIFGAPAVIEALVMYYNKDLLDKAPETFEELEALAKDEKYAFEGEEGRNIGFLANWTDFYHSYGLISGYGGYVFGDNGTNPEDIGLNTPGAIEGIEYATKWYQETWPQGMLDKSSAPDFVNQSFADGNTAAIIAGPWEANGFNEKNVNYSVAKIPTLPNGEEYQPFGGGKGWVISAYTQKDELAQKFLDWVSSKEQQTKLYERLGEVPANQVAREEVANDDNELTAAVIEVYENAVPMPNIPQMAEVWVGAESLMFDATSGSKSAEEAANDAVQLIKDAIAQKAY